VSTPSSCLGSAGEGGAIESIIWRTSERRSLEQQLQEETQETTDGDADECTQCDDAASESSPLCGAHTQVDDADYSCAAAEDTELNTSGLTDVSDMSASLIAARSEPSPLVHCAPTQDALPSPATVLHVKLAEVFGLEQSSNNTLQLVYCRDTTRNSTSTRALRYC
jgi:hypothetical protein